MSAVGGNYISDGAIMAWLANHQDRVYGELKESMDLAERRTEFTSKLVDIKVHLGEADRNEDFGAVSQELQALMAEYGSDPELAELCASLEPMATKIQSDWQYANEGYKEAYAKYEADMRTYSAAVADAAERGLKESAIELRKPTEPPKPVVSYSDAELEDWTNLIEGKVDVASKNDQLTMIHIQELKASIDQSSQLGSAWIAGGDKTLDRIIGNFA